MAETLRLMTVFFLIILLTVAFATQKHKSYRRSSDGHCETHNSSRKCKEEPLRKHINLLESFFLLLGNHKKHQKDETRVRSNSNAVSQMIMGDKLANLTDRAGRQNYVVSVPHTSELPIFKTTVPPRTNLTSVEKNLLLLETESCGPTLEKRILRGRKTKPGEFPWLVRLRYKQRYFPSKGLKSVCGGSLITDRYVLTAAHCLKHYEYILVSVRLGEYNSNVKDPECSPNDILLSNIFGSGACRPTQDYVVQSFVCHPHYKDEKGRQNDIGLVKLKKRVVYTTHIQPVCLPIGQLRQRWNQMDTGVILRVAGWGMTEESEYSPIPLKIDVPLMDMTACRYLLHMNLLPGQLCVGDIKKGSPCFGDSGGPLVTVGPMDSSEDENILDDDTVSAEFRTVQIGIVSFGDHRTCTEKPTVFTSVEDHLYWIAKNMEP